MPEGVKGFQPGNKFGPGRPPKVPGAPIIQRMDVREVHHAFASALRFQECDIEEILAQPTITTLQKMVLAVVKKAMTGDLDSIEFVLNRTVGKVKESIDVSGQLDATLTRRTVIEGLIQVVPREKLIELVKISQGDVVNAAE